MKNGMMQQSNIFLDFFDLPARCATIKNERKNRRASQS